MDFTFDLPWPWSLTPAEALQLLTRGLLPSAVARIAVAALTSLVALPAWKQRGTSTYLVSALVGMLGWFLSNQPLLALGAVFVVYFTLATYRASARGRGGRLLALIALRLLALLLTCVAISRPTLSFREENRTPSLLLILPDTSLSMTIKDEYGGQTREQALKAMFVKCGPIFEELQNESQITVKFFGFDGDIRDFDPAAPADGKRSDYGNMLYTLFQRFGAEPNLRGLLIIGDGADNGVRYVATSEAGKWRSIQCPVNCFVVGRKDTSSVQKDLAVVSLFVEPAPVYVKGKMTLRAKVHAFGCEGFPVKSQIFFDGVEAKIDKQFVNKEEVAGDHPAFPLTQDNELVLEATAPQVPGEIRVTVKLSELTGEVTVANNEISTYVTVIKEGVSVLFVGPLHDEKVFIRSALSADPRLRLFECTRQTDAPPPPTEADLFQLDRQSYDVVILYDVSAKRLLAGNPKILETIRDLVLNKGMGLLMMGGADSFGGSPDVAGSGDWEGTPVADLLPVKLDVNGHIGDERNPVEMHPTAAGEQHFLLQLASTPKASKDAWERLNRSWKLSGINRLARPNAAVRVKPGAVELATSEAGGKGELVMAAQSVGKGRVLAFAGDTTYLWRNLGLPETTEGVDLHARFWKQTVLWLAQQENSEGSVWVKPDFRRIAAGGKQAFSVGVRGKTGMDLPGGKYKAQIIAPDGTTNDVPVRRDRNQDRGEFWKTDAPGEYRLEVSGVASDVDQKPVSGKASVRFLVYQDDSELLRQAADPEFLEKLAQAGGGRPKVYQLDDLKDFLRDLKSAKLPGQRVKTTHWPEWRKPTLTPFLPIVLILFVALLGLEWGLRRFWGMA